MAPAQGEVSAVSRARAAQALSMVMKGVQAFEARDLKMAAAAISMAEELNEGGAAALNTALAQAGRAIRKDDRRALLEAVAAAAALIEAVQAPAVRDTPVKAAPVQAVPEQTAAVPIARPVKPVEAPALPVEPDRLPAAEVVVAPPGLRTAALPPEPPAPEPGKFRPVEVRPAEMRPAETRVEPMLAVPAAEPARRAPPPPEAEAARNEAVLPPAPASRALLLLGEAEHALGRGDEPAALDALAHAVMSSATGPEAEDLEVGEAFSRLGGSLAAARRWAPAREAMGQGLAIKMRVLGKSHRRIAADLTTLSSLCAQLGDYEEAKRLAERGLTIRRLQSNADPKDLADSLVQYAATALGLEDFAEAAAALREALAIGRDVRAADLWMADVLDLLGQAVVRLEDAAAARGLHEQAFGLRRPLLPAEHPDIARSLVHIGGFLLASGALDDAETHFKAAAAIFEAHGPEDVLGLAQCLENLAVLEVRRQNLEPGRLLLVNAVERLRAAYGPDQLQVIKFETELAFLTLFTGDLANAAALGYAALRRARAPHHANLRRDLWYLLSQVAAARRETDAAIVFGKLAANAVHFQPGGVVSLETPLQRLFAARHGDVFRHLAGLLAKADRLPEASLALAMLKEDELFEMVRRDPARDPRSAHMSMTTAEAMWTAEGDDILRALADAGREDLAPDEAARRLRDGTHRFEGWLRGAQARCAGQPGGRQGHAGLAGLGARVGLLQLVPTPGSLLLLLSTNEFQISREVQVTAGALRRLALTFRQAVESRAEDVQAAGAELYAYLIAPVAEIYRELGIKTLLIGAEGWLRYVPFAALHDGALYLAETTATVLLTEAWTAESPHWPEKPTIAALGDSSAAVELRGLVRNEHGAGMMAGSVATDALFHATSLSEALAERQIVHVASRTRLDGVTPANSYLTLGDGSQLLVTALSELPYLFRDVVLVTLSGCETAGDEEAGDGSEVEGLGALLRWRGAGAVMASHWRPHGGAAALMTAFYEQRKGRKLASSALNAAQRAMMAGRDAHPYYWAGYFVLGGIE